MPMSTDTGDRGQSVTVTVPAGQDISLVGLTARFAHAVYDVAPLTLLDVSNAAFITLLD
jgi:hypothetical protein